MRRCALLGCTAADQAADARRDCADGVTAGVKLLDVVLTTATIGWWDRAAPPPHRIAASTPWDIGTVEWRRGGSRRCWTCGRLRRRAAQRQRPARTRRGRRSSSSTSLDGGRGRRSAVVHRQHQLDPGQRPAARPPSTARSSIGRRCWVRRRQLERAWTRPSAARASPMAATSAAAYERRRSRRCSDRAISPRGTVTRSGLEERFLKAIDGRAAGARDRTCASRLPRRCRLATREGGRRD